MFCKIGESSQTDDDALLITDAVVEEEKRKLFWDVSKCYSRIGLANHKMNQNITQASLKLETVLYSVGVCVEEKQGGNSSEALFQR